MAIRRILFNEHQHVGYFPRPSNVRSTFDIQVVKCQLSQSILTIQYESSLY